MEEGKPTYKRYCKTLSLRNDSSLISSYLETHRNVWPEIEQGIREVGILNMEIYIYGFTLFMIMDTVADFDHDKAMGELAGKPLQAEWEAYMSKYQDATADATAAQKWQLMECIYSLNR